MKTRLKEHNVDAYESIRAEFDAGTRKVSAIRATGTGKTYIAVRTSEDFISNRTDKCLFLSPSNYINDQFKDVVKEQGLSLANYDVLTYQYLIGKDLSSLKNKYNLIITDELHRLGAEVWRKKVEELLYQNLSASILGLTATERRYREGRNMNEELGYKCVSYLPVADAIERHILPAPKYIIGYSNYSVILDNLKNLAIKVQADQDFIDKINKKKIDWVKSNGLSRIVRRHLPKSVHKIIVFCESIERCDNIKDELDNILTGAGFNNLKFFIANSSNHKKAKKAIKEFSEDCIAGEVKIIISVNMLNEGIHVKGAEACFMFRKTTSGNIYLQQLGRILSNINTKKHPVVFDLVDNISNDWGLLSMVGLKQQDGEKRVCGGFIRRYYGEAGVEVNSYVEEEKEVLRKLKELEAFSLDRLIQELQLFQVTLERNPSKESSDSKERSLYYRCMNHMRISKERELLQKVWNEFLPDKVCLRELREFHKTYNRNPSTWKNNGREATFYYKCRYFMYIAKTPNKELIEEWEKYQPKIFHWALDEAYNMLNSIRDQVEYWSDLRRHSDPELRSLFVYFDKNKNKDIRLIDLWNSKSKYTVGRDKTLERLRKFHTSKKRNPRHCKDKREASLKHQCDYYIKRGDTLIAEEWGLFEN